MGLFDKLRKKENKEISQDKSAMNGSCTNDNRRFFLLVEDVFQLNQNMGIVVVGKVYGKIRVGDAVYLYHPGKAITLATVGGIEIARSIVQEAENQNVGIRLPDIKDKSELEKYTVMTSIRPQTVVDVNIAVENPQLLGLSMEYSRFNQDMVYLNALTYAICHSHFIVPVYLSKEPESNGDDTCTFREGAEMSFLSVTEPDTSKNLFPVFTDWNALGQWKNIFTGQSPRTMILRFPDAVTITKKGHEGLVINPYGPVSIILSMDLIDKIIAMEGYQREFGENAVSPVQEIKMEKETKITVGVPQETPEVRMIRENLITYARKASDIRRIDFFLKIDEKQEHSYLCVVDAVTEDDRKVFDNIYQAVGPYAVEIKYIDFVPYREADFVRDLLEKYPPVYVRE